jgi:hypothetical protein
MTGSGSAFFLRCPGEQGAGEQGAGEQGAGEQAAHDAVAGLKSLKCWTAIAQSVGAWD